MTQGCRGILEPLLQHAMSCWGALQGRRCLSAPWDTTLTASGSLLALCSGPQAGQSEWHLLNHSLSCLWEMEKQTSIHDEYSENHILIGNKTYVLVLDRITWKIKMAALNNWDPSCIIFPIILKSCHRTSNITLIKKRLLIKRRNIKEPSARRDIRKRHRRFPTHLSVCAIFTLLSFDSFRKLQTRENCGKQLL